MDLKNAIVIDVRTVEEYQMGANQGSMNIPLDTIPTRMEEIKAINEPIVLCCASGGRSYAAYQYLSQQGLSNLHDAGPWTAVDNFICQ